MSTSSTAAKKPKKKVAAKKPAKKKVVSKKPANKTVAALKPVVKATEVKAVPKKKASAKKKKVASKKKPTKDLNKAVIDAVHKLTIKRKPKDHEYFYLVSGDQIRDVRELVNLLDTLADEVFNYHVNDERNDFASWIEAVFQDKNLAERIRSLRNKQEMNLVICKYLIDEMW